MNRIYIQLFSDTKLSSHQQFFSRYYCLKILKPKKINCNLFHLFFFYFIIYSKCAISQVEDIVNVLSQTLNTFSLDKENCKDFSQSIILITQNIKQISVQFGIGGKLVASEFLY